MTAEQVKAAFGDDVELAEFDNYTLNADGTIAVNFIRTDLAADGFYGNWPYVIKTTRDIGEFEVTATVDPDEESAVAKYVTGTGKKQKTLATFTGVQHAGSQIPEDNLFLNGNKFYYSAGKTKCKAFRAYFWLNDVLATKGDAESRIAMSFADRVTGISLIPSPSLRGEGSIYTLDGRRIQRPTSRKGVYVKNGKKVIVK